MMLLLLTVVLSLVLLSRRGLVLRHARWSPLDSYLSVAIAAGLAAWVGQLSGLRSGSGLGVLLVLWGHAAVVLFYCLSGIFAAQKSLHARRQAYSIDVRRITPTTRRHVILAVLVVSSLTVAGAFGLREVVSESAGEVFGSLTRREVRYYTSVEGISSAGLPALLLLAPVGAGLAGVLAVGRPRWLLGVGVFAALAATTPSRTLVLETAIGGLLMYLYARGWGSPLNARREARRRSAGRVAPVRRRWLTVVIAALVTASLFVYFTGEGRALGKASAPLGNDSFVPQIVQTPLIYLGGNVIALSTAIDNGLMPVERGTGRTAWIFMRAASSLGMGGTPPETVADYVETPASFNTYSWIGDAYFDGGILLVAVWGGVFGCLGYWSHHRARRSTSLADCWFAAIIHLQLIASFNALKLLWLPSVVALFVGGVTFWWIDNHSRSQLQTGVATSA